MQAHLTSAEVMQLLGIKKQTLYAYASRGVLRRVSLPESRRSMYVREDVERLLARKTRLSGEAQRASESGASSAAGAGAPVIASAITEITSKGPKYRGIDVCELAVHPGYIENVAELLWTGVLTDEPVVWVNDPPPDNLEATIAALQQGERRVPILRVMAAASLVLGEPAAEELRSGSTPRLARRIISVYAGCLGWLRSRPRLIHRDDGEALAHLALRALGAETNARAVAALNAVLICCADHELSTATYTARVVASTGAGLQACLIAAIGAHSGHLLGGSCDRLESLIGAVPKLDNLRSSLTSDKLPQRKIPGFGHPIYPAGDTRGEFLLDLAMQLGKKAWADAFRASVDEVRSQTGLGPSLELGIVAVAKALDLPPRSASALWAVGRSVGWVAHVMEQRLSGTVIRPRARAIG
ncbi:MAG TPA: citrate synthase [Trinickia sp.]|uniref:citrate synthase n=1 Tax=Trinickia sp. TaxID=2571163 RepID=UPI002F3E8502